MKISTPKMPTMKKGPRIKPKRPFGLHAAFAAGGNRAFSDPKTMVAPDQAFSGAMAQPQGGAAPDATAMPSLPTPPGE
jgi:hypothetical protein